MSTHHHGDLYIGWRKIEVGITQLEQELAATQVTHPTDLYQPSSERLEKLYEAMAQAQRFASGDGEANV